MGMAWGNSWDDIGVVYEMCIFVQKNNIQMVCQLFSGNHRLAECDQSINLHLLVVDQIKGTSKCEGSAQTVSCDPEMTPRNQSSSLRRLA